MGRRGQTLLAPPVTNTTAHSSSLFFYSLNDLFCQCNRMTLVAVILIESRDFVQRTCLRARPATLKLFKSHILHCRISSIGRDIPTTR